MMDNYPRKCTARPWDQTPCILQSTCRKRWCTGQDLLTNDTHNNSKCQILAKSNVSLFIAAAVSDPEASERGSSLIGEKIHYRGIQSLFLTKRKELWLSANGKCGMRSRLARNCGYARRGDLECAVDLLDYHVLSSYTDFQLQFE